MQNRRLNNPTKLTLLLIFTLAVVRLFIAHNTGLGIGESYYARGVIDPQLSYFDQPPLFFWLSILSTKLFGFTGLGLRFPAILLFAGTSYLVYLTAKHVFNEWTGFIAVVLLNTSFVFTLPVATWFQPDAPLMFFWMLCVWAFSKLFMSNNSFSENKVQAYLWWLFIGVSIGLASLSKYHSVFLFFGIFMFIITNKKHHHWLKHPAPYMAVIIHFLILVPVIVWNANNNWASFSFQGNRAGSGTEFHIHFDWFLRSIIGQSIWVLPWIWFWLIQELVRLTKNIRQSEINSFFFWLSVAPILFFTLVTLWADTQFHFHWQAPGYLVLFIPLAFSFYKKHELNPGKVNRKLIIGAAIVVSLSTFFAIHMQTGFWQKWGPGEITRNTGGAYDPTIEGVDFDDVYNRFETEGWLNNENIFLGSERWWQTGKLDWALQCTKPMVIFDGDMRNYAYWVQPIELIGKDAVYMRFTGRSNEPKALPYFDSVEKLDDISIVRGGIEELSIEVYYCKNFHKPDVLDSSLPLDRLLMGEKPF